MTDEAAKAETRAMTAWVLETILKLLHPVMPFITEELWDKTAAAPRTGMLITEPWPDLPAAWIDPQAEAEIGWLVELVTRGSSASRRDECAAFGQARRSP